MSNVIQKSIDRFWQITVFRFLPGFITPDFFTVLRFVFIPFIILAIVLSDFYMAFFLFLISALSDSLDGSLARSRKMVSVAGAFFDIIADKLLNTMVLSFMAIFYFEPWLPLLVVLVDLMVLFGGLILNLTLKRKDFKSDFLGKIKMTVEMISIIVILIAYAASSLLLINVSAWILILLFLLETASLTVYWLKAVFESRKS